MDRFQGLVGIILILGLAWLASNNRKKINIRLVLSGIVLQLVIALLVLKVPPVTKFFQTLGHGMEKIEGYAKKGADFVYGGLVVGNSTYPANQIKADTLTAKDGTRQVTYAIIKKDASGKETYEPIATPALNAKGEYELQRSYMQGGFIFGFSVTATIILVCVLVAILYHFKVMQFLISIIAKAMNKVMRVSGAEALSNVASAFVGQVEAQVMIRPYLAGMTKSELLASMSGSLACIAGGILIVYVNMGAQAGLDLAPKLLTASLMAAPGALVISKIVFPETEESETMGKVKLEVKSPYNNVIDAISHGAGDGFKIAMNVIAMIIGFIALIALLNGLLGWVGGWFGMPTLSLDYLFGKLFTPIAWSMGVSSNDASTVATLLGKKLTINEFIAFNDLTNMPKGALSEKSVTIVSIAICGFANFSSVGMQIGGIGELAPSRRGDLAKLGLKALFCGTLASYLSATLVGLIS
jgi:concentrative nucleoside transporter, CNT family